MSWMLVALLTPGLAAQTPQPVRVPRPASIAGGHHEASGVVAVAGSSSALFVDDNDGAHVYWMSFDDRGVQAGAVQAIALGIDVPDPEDMATDGRWYYVVGSQSQGGRRQPGLVRFSFDATTRRVDRVEAIVDLAAVLATLAPEVGGRGRRNDDVLNIEGLTWDAARRRLWLGLRSPMNGAQAVLVPLVLKDPRASFTATNLALAPGGVVTLSLGGLAIRGLGYDATSERLLVMAGAATYADAARFKLFEWDGTTKTPAREIATFPAQEKPEGVTRITIGGVTRTLVVFDTSHYTVLDP